jgi:hypothetical protein
MVSLQSASKSLQTAEKEDGYRAACLASPANATARSSLRYEPWMDQIPRPSTLFQDPSIQLCTLHPSAESGMPHTRGTSVICIPAHFPAEKLEETIRHELVHIDQKRNPSVWKERLEKDGWTELFRWQLPQHYVERCRMNPDTIQTPFWAWAKRYVPLPLFERTDRPSLREVQVRWWDRETETLMSEPPPSFVQRYGSLSQASQEHPFELHAYHPV